MTPDELRAITDTVNSQKAQERTLAIEAREKEIAEIIKQNVWVTIKKAPEAMKAAALKGKYEATVYSYSMNEGRNWNKEYDYKTQSLVTAVGPAVIGPVEEALNEQGYTTKRSHHKFRGSDEVPEETICELLVVW